MHNKPPRRKIEGLKLPKANCFTPLMNSFTNNNVTFKVVPDPGYTWDEMDAERDLANLGRAEIEMPESVDGRAQERIVKILYSIEHFYKYHKYAIPMVLNNANDELKDKFYNLLNLASKTGCCKEWGHFGKEIYDLIDDFVESSNIAYRRRINQSRRR